MYPRGTHEAEATREVDWWDRTRAEYITITITMHAAHVPKPKWCCPDIKQQKKTWRAWCPQAGPKNGHLIHFGKPRHSLCMCWAAVGIMTRPCTILALLASLSPVVAVGLEQDGKDMFCVDGHQIPALFLLGNAKCGTTSLFSQLTDQFGVVGPRARNDGLVELDGKEAHFFNTDRVGGGLASYASTFPPCDERLLTGDATPIYLIADMALENIVKLYGAERVKRTTFAVLMCDPVQEAQSAFYHFHYSSPATPNPVALAWKSMSFGQWSVSDEHFGTIVNRFAETQAIDNEAAPLSGLKESKTALNLEYALQVLGHLVVIPTNYYYHDGAAVLDELLALVRARSGNDALHGPDPRVNQTTDAPVTLPLDDDLFPHPALEGLSHVPLSSCTYIQYSPSA